MENIFDRFEPETEKKRIVSFLEKVIQKTGINRFIIGVSGGIDSATSLYLLKEVVPLNQLSTVHLYYHENSIDQFNATIKPLSLPQEQITIISIKKSVDTIVSELSITNSTQSKIRIGNIMARNRMIALYDLAKKNNGLVCGTENKSEHYLGYFTRFGDSASDLEPLVHLYKTQVYKLAAYLGVPKEIIKASPTAGLWPGQTDEKELGFSYQEADQVLYQYYEKKISLSELKSTFPHADAIVKTSLANAFKHETPYYIK